jgi:hypothetical protein
MALGSAGILSPTGAFLNTATPLDPNGKILNTAPLNPQGAILNTNGISSSGSFASPFGAYPQTVPGMQSWAGFYGGNVQAPSFLPQTLGPSQAGPAPTQPGSYSGDWANPQTWANYFGGQYGFTAPQGAGGAAGALSAEQVSNPNDPALLGWEQDFGNPQTFLQNNTNWAQSLGTPNNSQAWMNPASWQAYFGGTEGFTAPAGVNSPAAALAAAAENTSQPNNPALLGWESLYNQASILANNTNWAQSLGAPPTNGNYSQGIGAWESPLSWAALYGGLEGFPGPIDNTLSAAQGFENITNPNDPSLLGWELDYGNPQTVVSVLQGQQAIAQSNAQQTATSQAQYNQQLAAYNQQVATYNQQLAAQQQQAAQDQAQAAEQQDLIQGQQVQLQSDQALVNQFPPNSSEYQFYQEQISLLDSELGNEQGALQAAQAAEDAATSQEQIIVQNQEGLHPPQPYNPATSGPPAPPNLSQTTLAAEEALGQPITPGAIASYNAATQTFTSDQQAYQNYLLALANSGGPPAQTQIEPGTQSASNPGGLPANLFPTSDFLSGLQASASLPIQFATSGLATGGAPGGALGFQGGFGDTATDAFGTVSFPGAPLFGIDNIIQQIADTFQGLGTTEEGLAAPPAIPPPDLGDLGDVFQGGLPAIPPPVFNIPDLGPIMLPPLPPDMPSGPIPDFQMPPGVPQEIPDFQMPPGVGVGPIPPFAMPPDYGGMPPANPTQVPYIAAPNVTVPQDIAVTGQQGIGLGPLGNFGTAPEPPDFPTLALESGLTGNVPQVSPADFFDTTLQGLIPFEQAQPFLQAPQDFGLAQSADAVWPDIIQRPSDEAPPTWNIPFTKAEEGIQKTGTTTTIADAVLKLTGEPLTFTQKLALAGC